MFQLDATTTTIIAFLALGWFVQLGLSYYQMRRFYKRIAELRKTGMVSIGMAGSAWRRRQYAVISVDPQEKIVQAEQLSGWTIFASLKPIPGLAGYSLSDLMDETVSLPVSKKLRQALQDAVKHIRDAEARKRAAELESASTAADTVATQNQKPEEVVSA